MKIELSKISYVLERNKIKHQVKNETLIINNRIPWQLYLLASSILITPITLLLAEDVKPGLVILMIISTVLATGFGTYGIIKGRKSDIRFSPTGIIINEWRIEEITNEKIQYNKSLILTDIIWEEYEGGIIYSSTANVRLENSNIVLFHLSNLDKNKLINDIEEIQDFFDFLHQEK